MPVLSIQKRTSRIQIVMTSRRHKSSMSASGAAVVFPVLLTPILTINFWLKLHQLRFWPFSQHIFWMSHATGHSSHWPTYFFNKKIERTKRCQEISTKIYQEYPKGCQHKHSHQLPTSGSPLSGRRLANHSAWPWRPDG